MELSIGQTVVLVQTGHAARQRTRDKSQGGEALRALEKNEWQRTTKDSNEPKRVVWSFAWAVTWMLRAVEAAQLTVSDVVVKAEEGRSSCWLSWMKLPAPPPRKRVPLFRWVGGNADANSNYRYAYTCIYNYMLNDILIQSTLGEQSVQGKTPCASSGNCVNPLV